MSAAMTTSSGISPRRLLTRGTEALISIASARSGASPTVIRGPGAGGMVTASGVLADILRAGRQ